ncbi:amino acid permease [Saccharibacillus sp. CPCC 101409]|uniref:APC family permease n=1 Tax=Saccharibacillus sp. CPCC 101409 TaxID=3058041 RepID=UPI0026735F26|nr:amino acid permease [Saccharibacillus sp. CPCC 101409]MDO3410364.1 amino acid permease [Saccharibacillus sp. CPCC 101409]
MTPLKKSVTFLEAMAIVVGMIIGSGIFLKPGIVLSSAGSPLLSILAWTAGGVITLAAALSIAEIAAAIPRSGGLYAYMEELYGETTGFLLGWVQAVISYPASVAALAIAFASYSGYFLPMNGAQQKGLAIGILLFILAMNALSTKYGGIIQLLATAGKLIPVVGIVGFGLLSGTQPGFAGVSGSAAGAAGFGAAILGTLWAYDGWIGVTNMAGEMKNPAKTLPKVILIGVSFVIVVYVLFNLAIFRALPFEAIVSSPTPGADAAKALLGSGGGAFITAGIIVSVLGALNGYLMTAARVPQAMGERGSLPFSGALRRIHPRFGTPANALIFQAALAIVYIFSGTFNTLTDLLVFVLWIFFTAGVFGVFILRRRVGTEAGRYRVPLYPLTPIVGIAGGLYILVSTLTDSPTRSLIGIGITLIGLPVFYAMKRRGGVS